MRESPCQACASEQAGTREPCRRPRCQHSARAPGSRFSLLLTFTLRANSLETARKELREPGFSWRGHNVDSSPAITKWLIARIQVKMIRIRQASAPSVKLGLRPYSRVTIYRGWSAAAQTRGSGARSRSACPNAGGRAGLQAGKQTGVHVLCTKCQAVCSAKRGLVFT